eukprot:5342251-Pyramimonas_sp.AAC.1
MCHANTPAYLQYALLAPLVCTTGSLVFEGMTIHNISWDVCIRTGGPEGPLLLNLIICAMWGPIFRDWDIRGVGYVLEGVCGEYERRTVVNHFVWADNCYLVSASST